MSEIRPIRTEVDYESSLAEVERLRGAALGTPEGDHLDVLATLLDAYESEHHPMDSPDPIEAILFRIEQQGLTRQDLEGILGARSRISEVLNRRRGLSITMIRHLHDKLGISAEGRVSGAPTYLAIGPAAYGGLRVDDWLLGVTARWDAYEKLARGASSGAARPRRRAVRR